MRFYRSLQPFKLISFDLDDTLYDNHKVIIQAEQQFLLALRQWANLPHLTSDMWHRHKQALAVAEPLLSEDVVQWRVRTLELILRQQPHSAANIQSLITKIMDVFLYWRHQVDVPVQNLRILDQLAQRYPLVAISNGNIEPTKIGLNQFSCCLRGGEHGRAKPHFALFAQAAAQFQLPMDQILHIGDHLETDIQGAVQAGCQAGWLNLNAGSVRLHSQSRNLPTFELSELKQLLLFA